MEKAPVRSKGNRLLKFLPKATSFAIPNPPYSPGRGDKAHARKGFSGPIFSIVPAEARRRPTGRGFETPEPTSPKVSCIGQVRYKTSKACSKSRRQPSPPPARTKSKPRFAIGRIFGGKSTAAGRRGGGAEKPPAGPSRAPPLGQMRRFASGRDALASFDWKAHRVADASGEFFSEDFSHDDEYSDGEEHVKIPHSAPLLMGGGVGVEPRKEVNLWKRRTMSPPRPLNLE